MDNDIDPEIAAERRRILAEHAASGGGAVEDHPQDDYFAAGDEFVVAFPDGKSSVSHKTLTEGELRKYRKRTSRDVTLDRSASTAKIQLASGEDRYELLKVAICDWNLMRAGKPLPFSKQNLEVFLEDFPPHLIDLVEKDIRAKNPALRTEATIEELEEARDEIDKQIEQKRADEEGKASTSVS